MTMEQACTSQGCKRPYRAKGYCNQHYKKWRRGELPKSRYKTCVQESCRKKRSQKGLCGEHFNAVYGKKAAEAASATAPAA